MKKYITGRSDILIEEVSFLKETDATLWYINSKGVEQNCRKKSTYSQVHDSFIEAKQYLINKETEHFEKLSKWVRFSSERIEKINKLTL